MAPTRRSVPRFLFVVVFTVLIVAPSRALSLPGGRKDIPDVKGNKEVQILGSFCVDENNKKTRSKIIFKGVISGQLQVVAGFKYYLHVKAADGGVTKFFDAIVVDQPWRRSKTLISFQPSP